MVSGNSLRSFQTTYLPILNVVYDVDLGNCLWKSLCNGLVKPLRLSPQATGMSIMQLARKLTSTLSRKDALTVSLIHMYKISFKPLLLDRSLGKYLLTAVSFWRTLSKISSIQQESKQAQIGSFQILWSPTNSIGNSRNCRLGYFNPHHLEHALQITSAHTGRLHFIMLCSI